MKRKLISFLILILIFKSLAAQQQNSMPPYENVVTHLFTLYNPKDYPDFARLVFEKRSLGWFYVIKNEKDEVIKNELLWSEKKKGFVEQNLPKVSVFLTENNDYRWDYLYPGESSSFEICPFYGYVGWDNDVIKLLEKYNKNKLTDTLLYALGRAYSSYAGNLLSNNTGYADEKRIFKLPEGQNCMNAEQLAEYRKYENRAIECFKRLYEKNPEFQTLAGSIGTKYSNECMFSFYNMRVYQNETEAIKEIPGKLYDDFYIAWAKNILNPCANDAILVTYSDNDYFPLLYLQTKLGIRKDILVLNISFLNTSRYINHLRKKFSDCKPLDLTIKKEKYKQGTNDYLFIIPDGDSSYFELNRCLAFAMDTMNRKNLGGVYYNYFHTNNFFVKVNAENYVKNNPDAAVYKNIIFDKIKWGTPNRFFSRSEYILLDIIATNQWKRPVYFSGFFNKEALPGFDGYLQQEGMIYRLVPYKENQKFSNLGFLNRSLMYKNMVLNVEMPKLSNDYYKEYTVYLENYKSLVEILLNDNENALATTTVKKVLENLPNEAFSKNLYHATMFADYSYRLNLSSDGSRLTDLILKKMKTDLELYKKQKKNEDEINYRKQVLDLLIKKLVKFELDELADQARDLKSSFEELQ